MIDLIIIATAPLIIEWVTDYFEIKKNKESHGSDLVWWAGMITIYGWQNWEGWLEGVQLFAFCWAWRLVWFNPILNILRGKRFDYLSDRGWDGFFKRLLPFNWLYNVIGVIGLGMVWYWIIL